MLTLHVVIEQTDVDVDVHGVTSSEGAATLIAYGVKREILDNEGFIVDGLTDGQIQIIWDAANGFLSDQDAPNVHVFPYEIKNPWSFLSTLLQMPELIDKAKLSLSVDEIEDLLIYADEGEYDMAAVKHALEVLKKIAAL